MNRTAAQRPLLALMHFSRPPLLETEQIHRQCFHRMKVVSLFGGMVLEVIRCLPFTSYILVSSNGYVFSSPSVASQLTLSGSCDSCSRWTPRNLSTNPNSVTTPFEPSFSMSLFVQRSSLAVNLSFFLVSSDLHPRIPKQKMVPQLITVSPNKKTMTIKIVISPQLCISL